MANVNAPDRLNRIVEGTVIQGEIKADSNLRIDGFVKGIIHTKGRLVIGVSGKVEGDIVCQNADVEGEVLGTIKVEELLSLKATAKLTGKIITHKLAIEPGAEFTGTCDMGGTLSTTTDSYKDKGKVTVEDILEEHA
ncbi:MAG: polymer-forming cytoskeletal protein [Flavobacteriales bacterium]|nr:polymer-forming cytoskeletal protein [Flavobacteriales bacterium]